MTTAVERKAPSKPERAGSGLGRSSALALALALVVLVASVRGAWAQGPRLAVDADPKGNAPGQLGPLDSCISVGSGDIFDVDITIADVKDLLAWELYFQYDPAVVTVADHNVRLFQQANPGSNVFDVSDGQPRADGVFRLAAADTADPPSPDSGSGVLARLTLKAVGRGISPASLASRDLDGDGKPDQGPFLRDANAEPIGDDNGDTFFDGPVDGAQIAVDLPCPPGSHGAGSSASTNSNDNGSTAVYILGPGLAVAAVAVFSAFIFLYRRRLRAQSH